MKKLLALLCVFASSVSAQSFTVEWDDPASTVCATPPCHYKMVFPPETLATLAGALAQVTPTSIVYPNRPPQVILPGDGSRARMPDGSIISMGINGEIYRDAIQLSGVAARQGVAYGVTILAQGKTDPKWWKWTGASWVAVANFDPAILKDLPAPTTPALAPKSVVRKKAT